MDSEIKKTLNQGYENMVKFNLHPKLHEQTHKHNKSSALSLIAFMVFIFQNQNH